MKPSRAKQAFRKLYKHVPLKREMFTAIRKVVRPGKGVYKHLHFCGEFPVQVEDSNWIKIHHYGFELENDLFWQGLDQGWEKTSIGLWKKLVRRADVIFDIGANTGLYSLTAKSLNPPASVYAMEPVKRVFEKLLVNRDINDFDIVCLEVAASNADGTAIIYDTPAEHVYSVAVNKNLGVPEDEVIPTEVKIRRLETLIRQHDIARIDLMKIDVETHEPEVLEGLGEFLEIFRPTMLIEILNDEVGERVESLIRGLDYRYFNIDEASDSIREVSKITKSDYYNFLLCSSGTARELGLVGT